MLQSVDRIELSVKCDIKKQHNSIHSKYFTILREV